MFLPIFGFLISLFKKIFAFLYRFIVLRTVIKHSNNDGVIKFTDGSFSITIDNTQKIDKEITDNVSKETPS